MIEYKGWHIKYNPKSIPVTSHDFDVVHQDYDGAEDAHDDRSFTCADLVEACELIDEYITEEKS